MSSRRFFTRIIAFETPANRNCTVMVTQLLTADMVSQSLAKLTLDSKFFMVSDSSSSSFFTSAQNRCAIIKNMHSESLRQTGKNKENKKSLPPG